MKIAGKFFLLLGGIALTYILLAQVNWLSIFRVDENQHRLEEKLGEMVLENLEYSHDFIDTDSIMPTLDSLFVPLLDQNHIDAKDYRLYLMVSDEVNAFALPDNQIVLTTGLIDFLDSADYVSAILAHEIAHCEKNHVMRALVTNFGLDLLLSSSGAGEVTSFLTSQAFSRKLEKEADETAVDYLQQTKVDPNSLVKVMELFDIFFGSEGVDSWVSSHPNPSERKAYIRKKLDGQQSGTYKSPISRETYKALKRRIQDYLGSEPQ